MATGNNKGATNPDVIVRGVGFLGMGPFQQKLKWNGKHRTDLRNCIDCKHLIGYASWWCQNQKAVEQHGTAIPVYERCDFWEPCEKEEAPVLVKISQLFRKDKAK